MKRMKRRFRMMIGWILALCCVFGTVCALAESGETVSTEASPAVPAQNETGESEAIDRDAAEDQMPLGVSDLIVQQQIAKQGDAEQTFLNARQEGTHYVDYGFGSIQYIQGIYSVLSLYAEVPDYAKPKHAVMRVSYTASDLILADHSSLTFSLNGTPFYSTYVQSNAEQTSVVLYVPVPAELMMNGFNLLEISAYIRLTDDEGCSDDYNGANWVKFDETTCLRVSYELSEQADELSVFPYPFISKMDPSGAACAVAVSDAAADDELTAALNLMAGFGTALSSKNDVDLVRVSETERNRIIYIGLLDNTPKHLLSLLEQDVPSSGALIQRVEDGEKEYLLVIAKEPDALLEAVQLLSDSNRVSQLHSRTAFVSVGEARDLVNAGVQSSLAVEGRYTFKDILGHGASFVGPFHQSATIYLPVPEDYALSDKGKFTFHIRYSENLDWDRSLMTVYWGSSVPLFSRKLSPEGASGETVSFSVPADAVAVPGTFLTIAFDLEVKDLDCTPRQLNMPWAYIAENSALYLPQGERAGLSLSNRPAPFQMNSRMNKVLVVLPEQADADELILAGRTVAMLGAGSVPYGSLHAVHDEAFNEEQHGDSNLILVGKPSSNHLIAGMNGSLHFKYNDDLTALESSDRLIFNEDYAKEVGVIQLLTSPYSVNQVALVLSAAESIGIKALIERISSDRLRWALAKEAVLVDAHGQAESYQFTTSAAASYEQAAPSFSQVLTENREPLILLLIGFGSILLVFIGLIIVIMRSRRNNKREKD